MFFLIYCSGLFKQTTSQVKRVSLGGTQVFPTLLRIILNLQSLELTIYSSLLILNNDKCTEGRGQICNQRVAGLNLGLQVP